jgi:hypothetical protein
MPSAVASAHLKGVIFDPCIDDDWWQAMEPTMALP